MANVTTVARPYAKAILALAESANAYAKWTAMLESLAGIAQDPLGRKVLSNLAISPGDKAAFIIDVAQGVLSDQCKNLIKLLARGKRLLILPELFRVYEDLRKKAEHLTNINLVLAQNVDAQELKNIEDILKQNFTGTIILSEKIDAELISGGLAQIGNRVIDASIIGRLHAMRNLLRK